MQQTKPNSELGYLKRESRTLETLNETDDRCAYCGMIATDNEHVVPYSFLSPLAKRKGSVKNFKQYIVRSCSSCNGLASSKMFENFWEKKRHIAKRLKEKNKKLLSTPDWTDEEYQELEGRLLRHVFASQTNKKLLKIRLENLERPEIIGVKEYE